MTAIRNQSFTYMSSHALRRTQMRTRMSAYEIQTMLDKRLYVDTGRKPGFDRHHLLFYSQKDGCCFVAIRDESSGTVVTILPLDYHENLAWKVSGEDVQRAQRLASRRTASRSLHLMGAGKKKPKYFRISVLHADCQGDRELLFLAKFPCGPYANDHQLLIRDNQVLNQVDSALGASGVNPRNILTLVVRLGTDVVAAIDL